MKVSDMLLIRSESGNGVPAGMAWQWIHCTEDEKLHMAGKHDESMKALGEAKKIVGIK
jgi:hypothetical protein